MIIKNRIFSREYEAKDSFEAGIVLTGSEVKSLRLGRAKLENAYGKFDSNQNLLLVGADIAKYEFDTSENLYDSTRSRRLLLSKKELNKLFGLLSRGGKSSVLIPSTIYFKGKFAKVEINLCTPRKNWQVGKYEKERDQKREAEKELKYNK